MVAAGGIVGEYDSLYSDTDADLLAMQVGDFYEFFGENAETVHEELDLKLSEKSSDGEKFPMAGVPVNEIDGYVHALVDRGYRVAIADQHETKNGHARAIERVVTPGTSLSRSGDDTGFLIALTREGDQVFVALVDVATGRCFADTPHEARHPDDIVELLAGMDPAEVLIGPDIDETDHVQDRLDAVITHLDPETVDERSAPARVRDQFGSTVAETLGLADGTMRSIGAILAYLERTDDSLLNSLTRLRQYRADETVTLDATTQRNLELTETFRGEVDGSLLGTIDHTVTAGGRRRLREWLLRPTQDVEELQARLESIDTLIEHHLTLNALREHLADAYDLERLATRCAHGSASPRDLGRIRDTLRLVPVITERITADESMADTAIAELLNRADLPAINELQEMLASALVDDPPDGIGDGGIIRHGFDDDLDKVIEEHDEHREWFESLAEREASRYGFDRVSVGSTRSDGYFIQVPDDELERVPDTYEPVKTVAAGTRFRTDEVAERERRYLQLEDRRTAMERDMFEALLDDLAQDIESIQTCASVLSGLDVRTALARHARRNDWTRPTFRDDGVIEIDRGRHPVVEQTTRFVPNDCRFDDEHQQLLVTGPNMSGKSTYLRQVALISLLAQIGSYVPADRAAVTPVDGIFTRVGALDELAQGRSTFMVEMQELARILHQASPQSLVVLDEVGRGTATYDGISIAWAATEYLHNDIGAKTLFATHYHELTALAEHLPGVANVHVAVDESDDEVVFLRSIKPGATDRSYGIHVADLAGVPHPVVDRARQVLRRLHEEKAVEAKGRSGEATQVVFDIGSGELQPVDDRAPEQDPDVEKVLDALRSLDLEGTAPVELVGLVAEWKETLTDVDE